MEAVLSAYYNLEDVEINRGQLEFVGELLPKSKTKIPLIETADNKKKKRA
jgi:hypothetical protein